MLTLYADDDHQFDELRKRLLAWIPANSATSGLHVFPIDLVIRVTMVGDVRSLLDDLVRDEVFDPTLTTYVVDEDDIPS